MMKDNIALGTPLDRIVAFLGKMDRLRLPARSRRDVESILVRQISHEIDTVLPWQAGHGRRTAALAVSLGCLIGLSPEDLHDLKLAALLHDIGLVTLPFLAARHSQYLQAESNHAVQCHPRIGAELLAPFHFLSKASVIIAHHHERWDGTGYPYGVRGTYIPLASRLLAIADAFDAIDVPDVRCPEVRSHIAYRIMRVAAGTQFDPDLIERLRELLASEESTKNGQLTL